MPFFLHLTELAKTGAVRSMPESDTKQYIIMCTDVYYHFLGTVDLPEYRCRAIVSLSTVSFSLAKSWLCAYECVILTYRNGKEAKLPRA